jgi:hypothetical protein
MKCVVLVMYVSLHLLILTEAAPPSIEVEGVDLVLSAGSITFRDASLETSEATLQSLIDRLSYLEVKADAAETVISDLRLRLLDVS